MATNSTVNEIQAFARTHQLRHHVTFRFNEDTLKVLDDCTLKAEQALGNKVSRASIIRLLIDTHIQRNDYCDQHQEVNETTKEWLDKKSTEKASLSITEQQRIALRKLEFEIQKTNWSIPIDRNDTVQLLTMRYGKQLLKSNTQLPPPY